MVALVIGLSLQGLARGFASLAFRPADPPRMDTRRARHGGDMATQGNMAAVYHDIAMIRHSGRHAFGMCLPVIPHSSMSLPCVLRVCGMSSASTIQRKVVQTLRPTSEREAQHTQGYLQLARGVSGACPQQPHRRRLGQEREGQRTQEQLQGPLHPEVLLASGCLCGRAQGIAHILVAGDWSLTSALVAQVVRGMDGRRWEAPNAVVNDEFAIASCRAARWACRCLYCHGW